MTDDATKFIIGDTAISAIEGHPGGRRGFFGRKRRQRRQLTHCENCGAPLTGPYCGQCGQPAIDYRRSFRYVVVDLLDSFLNWDSKFITTIGLLIVSPWRLTNEFLAGRRVKYLHPARLYLLASILFFFAVSYGAKSIHVQGPGSLPPEKRAEILEDVKKENLTPEQMAKVEKALTIANLSPEDASRMMEKMKRKNAQAAGEIAALAANPTATASPSPSPEDTPQARTPDKNATPKPDRPFLQFGNDSGPKNDFEKWMEDRAKEKIGEHGTKVQLFLITVINNLPYMVLCCIPLFAFVLKVLYIRKGIFYIDHLVYALHIHTFAYLATMLIVAISIGLNRLMPGVLAGWLIALLWTAFAIQILLSIRRVYKQGWFFSIFKFLVGGFIYLLVLFVGIAATFFITLALP